jgi:hypothetical protein
MAGFRRPHRDFYVHKQYWDFYPDEAAIEVAKIQQRDPSQPEIAFHPAGVTLPNGGWVDAREQGVLSVQFYKPLTAIPPLQEQPSLVTQTCPGRSRCSVGFAEATMLLSRRPTHRLAGCWRNWIRLGSRAPHSSSRTRITAGNL